jgi:Ser/Thr protein kinase RdoA (MazF antagonist)
MDIHELAREAAAHWDGVPVKLLSHRENAVFEMKAADGRAALRLHREGYQSADAIRSELWWCEAMAKQGIAVPAPLPTPQGNLVRLSHGGYASAVTWVDGGAIGVARQRLDRSLAEIIDIYEKLGVLLRKIHQVTALLHFPSYFTRPAWDIPGLVGEIPFWGRFWEHPQATSAQRDLMIAARAFLQQQLWKHQVNGATIAPVHADVLRENILVNDHSMTLIDFDDSGYGFMLYDLGTALSQNLDEPGYLQIRAALMQGYGTQDTEMVDIFTLARTCASVGWTVPRLGPNDPIHQIQIARACKLAERLLG